MNNDNFQTLAALGTAGGVGGGIAGLLLPGFSATTGFIIGAVVMVIAYLILRNRTPGTPT
jgi:hypothetical protein